MSWDIVLFNSSEKISSIEDLDDNKLSPTDFCRAFREHFKNAIESDDHGEIKGDDYSIVYYCNDEPCSNILLNLYGEAALYELIPLAIKYNWQIFDTGNGEMIDLNDPARNGYKNFQAYITQILNKHD